MMVERVFGFVIVLMPGFIYVIIVVLTLEQLMAT